MLANEMYLRLSRHKKKYCFISKDVGLYPTSAKGSNAVLSVKVNNVPSSTTSLTMDKGTVFTTSVDGTSYQFVTNQSYAVQPNAGVFQFDNVNIFEGTLVTFKYTVDSNDVDQNLLYQVITQILQL